MSIGRVDQNNDEEKLKDSIIYAFLYSKSNDKQDLFNELDGIIKLLSNNPDLLKKYLSGECFSEISSGAPEQKLTFADDLHEYIINGLQKTGFDANMYRKEIVDANYNKNEPSTPVPTPVLTLENKEMSELKSLVNSAFSEQAHLDLSTSPSFLEARNVTLDKIITLLLENKDLLSKFENKEEPFKDNKIFTLEMREYVKENLLKQEYVKNLIIGSDYLLSQCHSASTVKNLMDAGIQYNLLYEAFINKFPYRSRFVNDKQSINDFNDNIIKDVGNKINQIIEEEQKLITQINSQNEVKFTELNNKLNKITLSENTKSIINEIKNIAEEHEKYIKQFNHEKDSVTTDITYLKRINELQAFKSLNNTGIAQIESSLKNLNRMDLYSTIEGMVLQSIDELKENAIISEWKKREKDLNTSLLQAQDEKSSLTNIKDLLMNLDSKLKEMPVWKKEYEDQQESIKGFNAYIEEISSIPGCQKFSKELILSQDAINEWPNTVTTISDKLQQLLLTKLLEKNQEHKNQFNAMNENLKNLTINLNKIEFNKPDFMSDLQKQKGKYDEFLSKELLPYLNYSMNSSGTISFIKEKSKLDGINEVEIEYNKLVSDISDIRNDTTSTIKAIEKIQNNDIDWTKKISDINININVAKDKDLEEAVNDLPTIDDAIKALQKEILGIDDIEKTENVHPLVKKYASQRLEELDKNFVLMKDSFINKYNNEVEAFQNTADSRYKTLLENVNQNVTLLNSIDFTSDQAQKITTSSISNLSDVLSFKGLHEEGVNKYLDLNEKMDQYLFDTHVGISFPPTSVFQKDSSTLEINAQNTVINAVNKLVNQKWLSRINELSVSDKNLTLDEAKNILNKVTVWKKEIEQDKNQIGNIISMGNFDDTYSQLQSKFDTSQQSAQFVIQQDKKKKLDDFIIQANQLKSKLPAITTFTELNSLYETYNKEHLTYIDGIEPNELDSISKIVDEVKQPLVTKIIDIITTANQIIKDKDEAYNKGIKDIEDALREAGSLKEINPIALFDVQLNKLNEINKNFTDLKDKFKNDKINDAIILKENAELKEIKEKQAFTFRAHQKLSRIELDRLDPDQTKQKKLNKIEDNIETIKNNFILGYNDYNRNSQSKIVNTKREFEAELEKIEPNNLSQSELINLINKLNLQLNQIKNWKEESANQYKIWKNFERVFPADIRKLNFDSYELDPLIAQYHSKINSLTKHLLTTSIDKWSPLAAFEKTDTLDSDIQFLNRLSLRSKEFEENKKIKNQINHDQNDELVKLNNTLEKIFTDIETKKQLARARVKEEVNTIQRQCQQKINSIELETLKLVSTYKQEERQENENFMNSWKSYQGSELDNNQILKNIMPATSDDERIQRYNAVIENNEQSIKILTSCKWNKTDFLSKNDTFIQQLELKQNQVNETLGIANVRIKYIIDTFGPNDREFVNSINVNIPTPSVLADIDNYIKDGTDLFAHLEKKINTQDIPLLDNSITLLTFKNNLYTQIVESLSLINQDGIDKINKQALSLPSMFDRTNQELMKNFSNDYLNQLKTYTIHKKNENYQLHRELKTQLTNKTNILNELTTNEKALTAEINKIQTILSNAPADNLISTYLNDLKSLSDNFKGLSDLLKADCKVIRAAMKNTLSNKHRIDASMHASFEKVDTENFLGKHYDQVKYDIFSEIKAKLLETPQWLALQDDYQSNTPSKRSAMDAYLANIAAKDNLSDLIHAVKADVTYGTDPVTQNEIFTICDRQKNPQEKTLRKSTNPYSLFSSTADSLMSDLDKELDSIITIYRRFLKKTDWNEAIDQKYHLKPR